MIKIDYYEAYRNEDGVYFNRERGYLETIRDHYKGVDVQMCFRRMKYVNEYGWRITHLESGLRISDCINATRVQAIQTAIRLCGFVAETMQSGRYDDIIQQLKEYKEAHPDAE